MLRLAHRGVAPATLDDVQQVATRRRPARGPGARRRDDRAAKRSIGYVVALVRRTRELPSVALGASPARAVHLLAAAKAAARLANRAIRRPGRRRRGRARRAAAPPAAAARGRARALHHRRRGSHRDQHGSHSPMSPTPRAAIALASPRTRRAVRAGAVHARARTRAGRRDRLRHVRRRAGRCASMRTCPAPSRAGFRRT